MIVSDQHSRTARNIIVRMDTHKSVVVTSAACSCNCLHVLMGQAMFSWH